MINSGTHRPDVYHLLTTSHDKDEMEYGWIAGQMIVVNDGRSSLRVSGS